MIGNRNILVIEDDHETRVALRLCLEKEGYFVVSAANGVKALELLKEMSKPYAILLDFDMPLMDGEEFLKAASGYLELNRIPVIQLSAKADKTKRDLCRDRKAIIVERFVKCTQQMFVSKVARPLEI